MDVSVRREKARKQFGSGASPVTVCVNIATVSNSKKKKTQQETCMTICYVI